VQFDIGDSMFLMSQCHVASNAIFFGVQGKIYFMGLKLRMVCIRWKSKFVMVPKAPLPFPNYHNEPTLIVFKANEISICIVGNYRYMQRWLSSHHILLGLFEWF